MAFFPRPSSPAAVWRDLRSFFATRQRHQLVFGALALAIPALIIAGFYHDSKFGPPPQQMYFVESWPADRSDAEIVARQKIDAAAKRKAMAERRAAYQRLAKSMNIE